MNWWYEDDPPHTVGGPAESLWRVREQAHLLEKINDPPIGIASRTQSSYRQPWGDGFLFFAGIDRPPWLNFTEQGRVEFVPEFILRENRVLGLNPRPIRCKVPGVRFPHIMAGRGDFSLTVVRCKQLVNAFGKNAPASIKLPISPEMSRWLRSYFASQRGALPVSEAWDSWRWVWRPCNGMPKF